MESSKNYGISKVRIISVALIIICHIFQSMNNAVCYYFNIGVWLFLFISGFLYGKRKIEDITAFYKNRLIRILIPYYCMLAVIVAVNVFHGEIPTAKELLSSLLCQQWYGVTVSGCGHLWYISCILFCYLITPLLQWVMTQHKEIPLLRKCIFFVVAVIFLHFIYSLGGMVQATTSILPYILGYFISVNDLDRHMANKNGGGITHMLFRKHTIVCDNVLC